MTSNGARVHIYGDWDGTGVKKAQSDLTTFQSQAADFTGAMEKSFMGMGAKLGGALAIGAIGATFLSFLRDSMAAAVEDEKSMVTLAKAMSNVGEGAQTGKVEDFIKAMSLATGVADDELRPAFQRLVTATGDAAKAQDLLQTSMDISAATGKDLTTVTTAMSKAANGNIGALTRLGVPIDQNTVKTKDFGKAVDILNQKFGGQAAAAADTYSGKLARLSTAAGEAQETIGYALLKAVDDISQSFGGTGGLVKAISDAGDQLGTFTTGVGVLITKMVELGKLGADAGNGGGWMQRISEGAQNMASAMIPGYDSIILAKDAIFAMGLASENAGKQAAAGEAAFRGYAGAFGSFTPTAQAAATANEQLQASLTKASDAADKMYRSVTSAKGALDQFNAAISQSGSMDQYKKDLLEIADNSKKVSTTLSDQSNAGLANRDKLRGYFSDLVTAAQDWGNRYGATATQVIEKQAGMLGQMRADLIAKGYKASDIDKFLGGMGLWNKQIALMASGMSRGQAASSMRYAGMALGNNFGLGIVTGIRNTEPAIAQAGASAAARGAEAARYAAQVQSPSKVWAEIGTQMGAGLVVGLKTSSPMVADAAKSIIEVANKELQAQVDKAKEALSTAKQAFNDFKTTVSDAIMGGIDFSAAAPKMDEAGNRVGKSFIDALTEQANNAKNFALQVGQLITMGLSKESLTLVLQAGVQAGTAIAGELISGGATAIATTNQLVATTQAAADTVGLQAADKWYGAGVTSAQNTYNGFKAAMGGGGPVYAAMMNVMDNVAAAMSRTATVTVVHRDVYESVGIAGKRAMGGPVSAAMAYVVGEKGPEVFVPGSDGNIIANGGLPSASGLGGGGNSYNITIQAGVGDPRAIGQQVVEYIRRFEQANGNVFAAA